MEGSFLIPFFAFMGALSLYVVVATIVGRAVYSRTKGWEEDVRYAAAIFCGFVFPISVPIIILVVWFMSIINVPMGNDERTEQTRRSAGSSQEINAVIERVNKLENEVKKDVPIMQTSSKPMKQKFKAGDLITGVSGNPAGYKHLYEGCVCRVLKTNEDKAMDVVLVDHIDSKAQREQIGETFKAPPRYFTLIKPKVKPKKVAKKKGK